MDMGKIRKHNILHLSLELNFVAIKIFQSYSELPMSNRNAQRIEVGMLSGAFNRIKVLHLVCTCMAASATRHRHKQGKTLNPNTPMRPLSVSVPALFHRLHWQVIVAHMQCVALSLSGPGYTVQQNLSDAMQGASLVGSHYAVGVSSVFFAANDQVNKSVSELCLKLAQCLDFVQ